MGERDGNSEGEGAGEVFDSLSWARVMKFSIEPLRFMISWKV